MIADGEDREGQANRQRRRGRGGRPQRNGPTGLSGVPGGRYAPLAEADLARIRDAALAVLEDVGLSEAPPTILKLAAAQGCKISPEGRLTLPRPLVERALAELSHSVTLPGQRPEHDLELSGTVVHVGSGGAAPSVVDLETGRYRDSTLADLYAAARLVDALDNIHFFSRSLVARDMPDALSLDVNTAYASLSGTAKHVCTSVAQKDHVVRIARICGHIAGSAEAFAARPFLSLNVNHMTPPLRCAGEACEVLIEAARLDIPVHVNAFGQLGASSPVTFAGSLAQTVAETLAGMIFAWLVNPAVKAIFGARPMITDLRSGAMSGGSGEQALLMAASTQMAGFLDLPNSCIAGATDSKIPDAQSGYEKALAVTLAAQAGANMITQACGMQAGLLGCSFEGYVIDNDMLGAILRSLTEVEVSDETLSLATIGEIARGEGHYLGHPETLRRMQSDFLYPRIADRRPPAVWEEEGALDIRARARAEARALLASHFPGHVSSESDRLLRREFDIHLPREAMEPL